MSLIIRILLKRTNKISETRRKGEFNQEEKIQETKFQGSIWQGTKKVSRQSI